ncbi:MULTISPECIES: proteasome-type protease [Stutzerimonas stutzeri subgroup]|uniref:Proteasome-type protease n=1 Tax=Stutzerimonas stutzeri CCUG 29243 TaxID=1196835 RepID=I4CUQ0_STUST|nr:MULTISPECIES: proteasome-type protease [Stutzerimonas stutzeri subgroup]AFM33807.1 proteasome-type protease [Stutzerimonas stutzeri CCUG 29243]MCQ2039145.1 proteasome-type protease [Stutzerimonas kunmingensis]RRU99969.1 peptidase [Stutzerimonas xanthomarina]
MTYCVAMNLADGLVFVSDSRTNAGVDHIATFRKLYRFGIPGERLIVLQTAGNLATSQAVVSLLRHRLLGEGANLHNVPTMFAAARLVGDTLREVIEHDASPSMASGIDMSSSFLVGGQIAGEEPQLYNLYPQGNFICATVDTPYFQIGESKYGKPILDRALRHSTALEQALRCALISFDSTIRSNLSVGMPLDVLVYRRDSLQVPDGYRVEEGDAYYEDIREQWCSNLRRMLVELPAAPGFYLD